MAANVYIYNDRTQKYRGENGGIITHQNYIENAQHGKWQNVKYQTIKWQNCKGTTQHMIENTHTTVELVNLGHPSDFLGFHL